MRAKLQGHLVVAIGNYIGRLAVLATGSQVAGRGCC